MKLKKDEFNKKMNDGWVLTNKQIDYISRYPLFYNAWAGSVLELFCFQRFWIWLAKFVPASLAPSTLTLIGLTFNLFGCITVIYYSPDFKSCEIPRFVPLLLALSTFLYQTLDALDGKQAYKVQNSAIEEMSDHGCDAISTVFVTLSIAALLQLGNNPFLLVTFLIISLVAFFFSHFVSHVTHCMIFGRIDVTEAQWGCIFGYILTTIYGQKIWLYPLFEYSGLRLTLGNLLVLAGIALLLCSICENIQISLMGKATPIEQMGIMIPRKKLTAATYNPLFAVGFLITCCYINYFYGLMKLNQLVFLFLYGFSFTKLIITLVLVNVSKGEFEKMNTSLIAPSLLTINCLVSHLYGDFFMNCYTALLCSLIWTIMDCGKYITYATWDVKYALDANVFSIKYPVGHHKNKAGGCGFYFNGRNTEEVLADWNKFKNDETNSPMREIFLNHLD